MFKRLKDKITEEVKISPSKFTASVQQWQQMAQAVVSPTSNSVIDAPPMDSFSIDGDYDETPQNSPAHGSSRASDRSTPTKSSIGDPSTFTLVDLQESTSSPVSGHANSRRSSFTSTTSESPAILFPVLETGTHNHFQSDLESCSERDESIFSSNVDNVSKEQLLSAFRKTQQRYHKYKGRYTDLIRHYRELEHENTKARTVLAECQDKALRRTAELKEQCQLEQKAKAHLEEVLRSDLEEKDHLIHTLETKIQLLKSGVDPSKVLSAAALAGGDATSPTEPPDVLSNDEPKNNLPNAALSESEVETLLQEKIAKLENTLDKCKEAIHAKQELINQLEKDKKSITEREAELQNKIKELQLREEETSLTVAENKLMVHQELESKEEVIRQLNKQLAAANSRSTDLQKEIEQLQEGFKRDLAIGKQEASRLIQAEMQQIVGTNRKLEELLATRDQQLSEHEASLFTANQRLQGLKEEVESLREGKQLEANTELCTLQAKVAELELAVERSDLSARLEPVLRPLREIRESAQQLRGELTESLKATKGYMEDSVQDIHSRSSQLLAESKEELQLLREQHQSSESKMQDLAEKIRDMECRLKEKEEAASSFESDLSAERNSNCDLRKTLDDLKKQSQCAAEKFEESKRSFEEQLEKSELAVQQYKHELEQVREGLLSAESSEKKFIEELQEEIKRKEGEIEKLSEHSKTLEEQLQKERCLVEELTVKANHLSLLEAQIDSLKADNAQLLEEKNNLVADKNKEICDLEEKNVCLTKEVELLKIEKNVLSEEVGRLKDDMVENGAIQLREMEKSLNHVSDINIENEELKSTLNSLQASYGSIKEEHAVISKKLEESEKKCNELKFEVDAANTEVREKQQLLSELEAQLTSLSNCASELTLLKEEKAQLSETVALLKSSLRQSSEELQDKEGLMEEKQVELGNLLNLKTQELQELREELDVCKTELSNRTNLLELKTREYESLVSQSSAYADDLSTKSKYLLEKIAECDELTSQNASIKSDLGTEKERLNNVLEELTSLKKEVEALRQENQNLNERVNAAVKANESLEAQLKTLSEEHVDQAHLLKSKIDECAEKEAQLDNLADEMKRVDELSQELGRISDESEANVQVLSAEASSLAQKVEELTAKTQQMKEREVELVAKAQLADECQAEFIQLREAKAELQAKLARVEQAESQLAHLREAQVSLGNRLKQAEDFEKQCEHLRELASKVPELEKKSVQLKEAQGRVAELEEKCARLADECAKLEGAEFKVSQLEAECEEFRVLRSRFADVEEERNHLVKENSNLSLLREECAALKIENEKIGELSKECAELKEAKSVAEDLKIKLEEQLKESSDLQGELEKLRLGNFELERLRLDYENLLGVEQKSKHMEEECDRLKKECLLVADFEAECKTLRNQNARILELKEECDRLKKECLIVTDLEAECKTLRNQNARIHELEEECERLRSANQQTESGKAVEEIRSKDAQDNQWEDEKLEDKLALRGSEIECEDLREQLKAAKAEIEDLRSDLEFVRRVPAEKSMSPAKKQGISSLVSALEDDNSVAMPVVEEPMVAKKVRDLYKTSEDDDDEDDDDDEEEEEQSKNKQDWKEAYESLVQEHKTSMESHQQIIEDLKEQLKLREEKPRKKPWERERNEQDNTHFAAMESKVLGADGNSVGSVERLQHQVAGLQTQLKDSKRQHRQEVSDLRRMLLNNSHGSSHGATLEDATELEYLRNILYEYMMGKEPMVLARVIAAVVKFDSDQTKKILQKEEQRMTLLGHLGIS